MASRTHGYGFGLPTTPITPRLRNPPQDKAKMILKADGRLVEPHRLPTEAEKREAAERSISDFLETTRALRARGIL